MNITRTRKTLAVPFVVLAMTGLAACGSDAGDSAADSDTPSSTPSSSSEPSTDPDADASGTLALTADAATTGKCAVPSPETLSTFDTAFAGTVTSLDDGTATLSVDEWYAGDEAATVTVATPSSELEDLLLAVDFQEDTTYLVSADGGRVTLCGFTAEETPELEAMYSEAFAQ